MWDCAACPRVTHLLPHVSHDFLGKIFLVEDEAVEGARIGVLVGNFHTPQVFEPPSMVNI